MTRFRVKDVFHFRDGKSVLTVVSPTADDSLIPAGTYLVERGSYRQAVHVDSEMLVRGKARQGERSVHLSEKVNLPSGVPNEEVYLIPTFGR